MEREDVMRPHQSWRWDQPGHKDGLKKNRAAQLLGISRPGVSRRLYFRVG